MGYHIRNLRPFREFPTPYLRTIEALLDKTNHSIGMYEVQSNALSEDVWLYIVVKNTELRIVMMFEVRYSTD